MYTLASVYGQHLKLEPLHSEKELMWKREMNCLLSVCDYIVEFIPASQNLKDETVVEVKNSQLLPILFYNLFLILMQFLQFLFRL